LVEEGPGFAVGVVETGEAGFFGTEEQAGLAQNVREREDEPGVFGDDVGGEEIDFGGLVGDDTAVEAATSVDAVEALEELGGGFDLDADQARDGGGRKRVPPLRSLAPDFAWDWGRDDRGEVGGIQDDVIAFAIAIGAGDAEAVAGGGEGEGEFGDFSAALGGEFALE